MNPIDQAIKEFEQSQDWTIYKDYQKREMAFRAGVKFAKGKNNKNKQIDIIKEEIITLEARIKYKNIKLGLLLGKMEEE